MGDDKRGSDPTDPGIDALGSTLAPSSPSEPAAPPPERSTSPSTPSPDGQTLFGSRAVGQSRRQIVTNFADRPPLR